MCWRPVDDGRQACSVAAGSDPAECRPILLLYSPLYLMIMFTTCMLMVTNVHCSLTGHQCLPDGSLPLQITWCQV
jgi:hypothetical protein